MPTIRGLVKLLDGVTYPSATITFMRSPRAVVAQASAVVIPATLSVTTDGAGEAIFDILEGTYVGTEQSTMVSFPFRVPATDAYFQDCLSAATVTPWPDAVQAAIDARDEAQAIVDSFEADIEGLADAAVADAEAASAASAASAAASGLSATASATSAATSAASAAVAVLARDAAVAGAAGYYADTTAGLAAVALGEYFAVPVEGSNDAVILYREDAGPVATEITRMPSSTITTQLASDVIANGIATADARARATERDGRSGYVWDISDAAGHVAIGIEQSGRISIGEILHPSEFSTRDGGDYTWSVADAGGRLAIGIGADGGLSVNDITQTVRTTVARDGVPYVWHLSDESGAVAVGVTPAGDLAAGEIYQYGSAGIARDGSPFVWSVKDTTGQVAIGVRQTGIVQIAGGTGATLGYIAPDDFTSSFRVFNVRGFDGFEIASRTEWGATFDVRKPDGITAPVIDMPDLPMTFLPLYGQSNAGTQGAGAEITMLEAVFPASALNFNTRQAHGLTLVSEASLTNLQPARDTLTNLTATVAMMAYEYASREIDREPLAGLIGWTAWYGGQALSAFERGTAPWLNLLTGARAATTRAADYDRSIACPALVFVQGESGPFTGYQAALEALADDLMPEITTQMALDAEPKMVVVQTSSGATGSASTTYPVRVDQLAASRANSRIVLAGPMYQCPLQDNIHPTSVGRMLLGDMLGDVLRAVADTGDFIPLRPATVTILGSIITATFDVPFGDLTEDTDWGPAVANMGFVYTDSTSSASILSVAITAADTVTITLNTSPSGATPRLQYGLDAGSDLTGWSRSRANLYSQSPTPSMWKRMGFNVPPYVRHYCVGFDMDVS